MASNRIWRYKGEKIVILDSNALMMLFEFSINLEDELTRLIGKYDIVIPKPVLNELIYLSENGKGNKKNLAKSSLKIAKKFKTIDADGKNVDDAVLLLSKKINGVVVTNDKELRTKLKKNSCPVVFLRAKKTLEIE